jgi:hypothetical protein
MRAKASEPDVVTHCKFFQQLLQLVERVLTATAREVIRELVHLRLLCCQLRQSHC